MKPIVAGLVLAALTALAACSSRELYTTGQGWQRQECMKLADPAEQRRCQASAARSYEDYQREAAAAKAAR